MEKERHLNDSEYLKLAVRVINGDATAAEKATLDNMLKDKPELAHDYEILQQELDNDREDDLAELLLKAVTNTASTSEKAELRALANTDNERWRRCLEFGVTLQVVAESLQEARTSPLPNATMPDHVRKTLMANLQKYRGK